jgi:CRISPR/Cas system-associated exonuclease Cas4 (RecB family)
MQLSKTDFIQYLNCPKSLWLKKYKPEVYPGGEFSLFIEKLVKEGYDVEAYAKRLFLGAIDLPNHGGIEQTKEALLSGQVLFQAYFESPNGLIARADILEKQSDGTYHLYEVKSSSSISRSGKHNHIKDACFQKYVLEQNGLVVSNTSIIYLNKEFVKAGPVKAEDLLVIEDVSEEVTALSHEVIQHIKQALILLGKSSIDESNCSCARNTRTNHCDAFDYFNKEIPENNIYQLNLDVSDDFELSNKQHLHIESYRQKTPSINRNEIKSMLSQLSFPLHFYDYETYPTAIPLLDGMSPHQHLVFQVSMHTMLADRSISHYEYLANRLEQPKRMLEEMHSITGLNGTFISWHKSFETSRNKDLIKQFPSYKSYLEYINEHTFDLEDVFKEAYIDYRFLGRSSIKNVLPVLCPDLSYKDLEVQNGTMALDTWGRMILDPDFKEDKETTRKNLLSYCELDSLAMVKLYQELLNM